MAKPELQLPEEICNYFEFEGDSITPACGHFRIIADAPDYAVSAAGMIVRIRPINRSRVGKILKPWFKDGYPAIDLRRDGLVIKRLVHRIVCEAFNGPQPSPAHEVAHGDGNPANCHADNLRWATHAENEADKSVYGTRHRTYTKLRECDVIAIRAAPGYRGVVGDLAKEYGVSHQTISSARLGKNWASL